MSTLGKPESSQGFCICIPFLSSQEMPYCLWYTSEKNCSMYFVRFPVVSCRSEHLFQSLHDIRQETLSHRPESLAHAYQYLPTRMRAGTSCSVHGITFMFCGESFQVAFAAYTVAFCLYPSFLHLVWLKCDSFMFDNIVVNCRF